jgi:hypothetical protein
MMDGIYWDYGMKWWIFWCINGWWLDLVLEYRWVGVICGYLVGYRWYELE